MPKHTAEPKAAPSPGGKPPRGVLNRSPVLSPERSAELLERLLGELASQEASETLLDWAKISLPLKNTLLAADARMLEAAYQKRFEEVALPDISVAEQDQMSPVDIAQVDRQPWANTNPGGADVLSLSNQGNLRLAFPKEAPRKRSKMHLSFVRSQPCLVCKKRSR
ncbi:hypothetical protein ACVWZV_004563 [Bradyrhizobium sp. GM5.1]